MKALTIAICAILFGLHGYAQGKPSFPLIDYRVHLKCDLTKSVMFWLTPLR